MIRALVLLALLAVGSGVRAACGPVSLLLYGAQPVFDQALLGCADNVMLWTGPGMWPGPNKTDPVTGVPCFTVYAGAGAQLIWDWAVAGWKDAHGS